MNYPTVVAIYDLQQLSLRPNQFFNIELDTSPDTDKRVDRVEVSLQEDGTLLICASDEFIENIRVATYDQVYG
jgi:hypothetical protein